MVYVLSSWKICGNVYLMPLGLMCLLYVLLRLMCLLYVLLWLIWLLYFILDLLCCFSLIFTTLAIALFCKYHANLQENTAFNNATLSTITPNTTISLVNISKHQNNKDLLVTLSKPVYLQYKIIEENVKSRKSKPVKGYSRQVSSSTCNDKADLKFIEFIKAFVGETNAYKSLNWKIDYLHCKFVSAVSHYFCCFSFIEPIAKL